MSLMYHISCSWYHIMVYKFKNVFLFLGICVNRIDSPVSEGSATRKGPLFELCFL